jgi:hypothetical protein
MKSSSHTLHPHRANFCVPGSTSFASATAKYCQILPNTLQILQNTDSLVKVKVTLRLTVSQLVSQSWCRAQSGAN